jgi:hypothetical protein
LFRAEVLVVNVATQAGQLPEEKSVVALQLEDYLGDVPSSVHVVVHDDVAEGIENFVLEKRAQLLALVARKHGFFRLPLPRQCHPQNDLTRPGTPADVDGGVMQGVDRLKEGAKG